MKVTIAINNYNYSEFIIECVNSVLKQTYNNFEIIIVDDGSTDNSLLLLEDNYKDNSLIQIISKKNGGQLSSFNIIIPYIKGEVVFFLDADDVYKKNYVGEVINIYNKNKNIDFVFCSVERFFLDGSCEEVKIHENNENIGFSVLSSLYAREWVGNVTSSVSMKTKLLKEILPIPYESDWITRADDCLIWGSSILGANKYYLSKPLVRYRVHSNNNYYGKNHSNEYLYRRGLVINKLFMFLSANIDKNIIYVFDMEIISRNIIDRRLINIYLKIIFSSRKSFLWKGKRLVKLLLKIIKG